MQAARIATGGKDAHVVPRVYGRVGYDVPVAQSTTFRLKPYDTASDDDDASVVDEADHSVVSTNRPRGGENPLTTGVKQAVPYRTGREARYLSVSTE